MLVYNGILHILSVLYIIISFIVINIILAESIALKKP